jgi:hypothetical protein
VVQEHTSKNLFILLRQLDFVPKGLIMSNLNTLHHFIFPVFLDDPLVCKVRHKIYVVVHSVSASIHAFSSAFQLTSRVSFMRSFRRDLPMAVHVHVLESSKS